MSEDPQRELNELRSLLEQAPDGLFVSDLNGRYIQVNNAACELVGYTRELIGMSALELIAREDHYRLQQTRESLLRGAVGVSEWKLRRKDGSYVPVEVSAKILPDGRWQGFARDISERRELERISEEQHALQARVLAERTRNEEALRLSEERLRLSLQATPIVMFNQDLELRYTWVHDPKLTSDDPSPLGKTDFELMCVDDAQPMTEIKRRVLAEGVGTRQIVRTTYGGQPQYFDLSVEPLRGAEGELLGVTCAAWNVTEQRHADQNQRLLAQLGTTLMTITQDYAGTLTQLAKLLTRDLADFVSIDTLEGDRLQRVIGCADPRKQPLADALQAVNIDAHKRHIASDAIELRKPILIREVTIEHLRSCSQSDEDLQALQNLNARTIISAPLIVRDRLLGTLSLISSLSWRRYRQRDLELATEIARITAMAVDNGKLYQATKEAISQRDAVLGLVAHDLRSPLNTLIMQTQLLRKTGTNADTRQQKGLAMIDRSSQRMSRLIQDMLDVERMESGVLPVDRVVLAPAKLLDEVLEAQRQASASAGLDLRLERPDQLPNILGDRDRLLQTFDNLIGNAIKFTPSGGRVSVRAAVQGDEVIFSVSDTGPGIPRKNHEKLFERHWQAQKRDRRGAGLGLSIVKGIVEAHHGHIWIESDGTTGTAFHFSIPTSGNGRAATVHA